MDAYELTSPEWKLVMWYKCKELFDKGLSKAQICRETGLDKKTVRRYLHMSREEFMNSQTYKRMYVHLLDPYEGQVRMWLEAHNDLSSAQIYDWLREHHEDLPDVNIKTVYNFVRYIRAKYDIEKPPLSPPREYCKVEETAFGAFSQADFGEMWMQYEDGRKRKVYFFVMVLCRSRKKYVFFNLTPFTAEMAIYAHEKAFEYYGGKPKKIIYDQDAVLIKDENLGDCVLTKAFQAFVAREHFECIFCHKDDPESKGKVENAVKYVKYNFLRGRTFVTIEQLNEEGGRWLSRTANGLPHATTKLVPDKVFEEEHKYLIPYYGVPSIPERAMMTHVVHKHNVVAYRGNEYSVPKGTYAGPGSRVWVNERNGKLEIYSLETGKRIWAHDIPEGKGNYVLEPSHRKTPHIKREKLETKVLEYCKYDELSLMWMLNMKRDRERYYNQNLLVLIRGMVHFAPSTLHLAFEESLDRGMYNAKDLLTLCDRRGKRIPVKTESTALLDRLPDAVREMPEKTDINKYDQYFS